MNHTIPVAAPILASFVAAFTLTASGCGPEVSRYALVENSLLANNPGAADEVIKDAEDEYGSKSRVLYDMDRGMTLQLAGDYQSSNAHLEEAEAEVERLYTRRIRTEVQAFLINDTQLPFEGAPFEQVQLNVMKAINYAMLREWDEALVEARRIDHRLNVLADQVTDEDEYRADPFARYLSGILYEVTGDINNAFIAYRHAYEGYRSTRSWSRTPVPPQLREDLLRTTDALHLTQEFESYEREFGEVSWQSADELQDLAQVILISYNGRAPRVEDQFIDLPVSPEALELVLLTKAATRSESDQGTRAAETVLYGMSGHVVRVALPKLVPQHTDVQYTRVVLSGSGTTAERNTQHVYDVTAAAEKALDDRFETIALKAVARSASKFALAEAAQYGAGAAAGEDAGPLVALIVGILAKSAAIATEEADKRNWRTLPDQIQLARVWVPAGKYEIRTRARSEQGNEVLKETLHHVTLSKGETRFLLERVVL